MHMPARFIMQSLVSLATMSFCIAMLARGESATYYLPVITTVVGYWVPAPSMRPARQHSQAAGTNAAGARRGMGTESEASMAPSSAGGAPGDELV